MKIGIPRALIYWKKPYFWESFFENLGFEVLLSPKTNKEIVETGVKISDPETCFSNKVYFGHLKWLEEKCDLIFVPRLKTNAERLEYCPKFFGLPDLAKILVKTKILTADFDEKKESFERTLLKIGKKLGKTEKEIENAYKTATEKGKKEEKFFEKIKSERKKVVLISHPYNLYDEYVNLRIAERLKNLETEPIFIDEVPRGSELLEKEDEVEFHWEFAKEIMERVASVLNFKIDGAIEISSFACGCDAVLKEFVEKKFKEKGVPFLYLIIDEHTGEGGFQTRLEAFVDTI
jgi:predicted nucleotide-binding protein (sugar kinase/HSP70/actin superfamily)